jgi:hypothetical protein
VSLTISPPIRVVAFLGVLAAAALALFLFIVGRGSDTSTRTLSLPVPHTTPAKTERPAKESPAQTHRATPRATRVQTPKSGFPTAIDRAFRRHRVVVAVVYMPGSGVDAVVRKEARAAAIQTGAGYVPISAVNERVARQLVAKTGVLPAPAVLVLRRPGVVTATLGVTDRVTVVQALAEAKR